LEERLHPLSNLAWSLLGFAATIGREFPFPLLQTACNLADGETLAGWIDEMVRCRILRESGPDTYSFTHKQLHQVVYAHLSSARLASNRQLIAQALDSH
jgi:predicted ATPase